VNGEAAAGGRQTVLASDRERWDRALRDIDGHMLQSWSWGAFKSRFGWDVERVAVAADDGVALAQVLFRSRFGASIGYIPRGPALPVAGAVEAEDRLWREIDRAARRRRALAVIVERDQGVPTAGEGSKRFLPGPPHIQPARTVKVELLPDEPLLAQMHQKTRYNIRLAQRRGVTTRIADPTDEAVDDFYTLLQDTAERNAFGTHDLDYYRGFLREFGENAILLFAEIEDRPVAGLIAAAFGDEAIYMYGASSTRDRAHGAGFLIQFEAMRWARDRGCLRYDLWGIPVLDPQTTQVETGDRIAGTTGQDWRGLYEFKTRFGGQIVQYPPTRERRYVPLLASLARRYYSPGAY
jgi:peptidoglycan pentaglycine glycine transferase (the first glycine)